MARAFKKPADKNVLGFNLFQTLEISACVGMAMYFVVRANDFVMPSNVLVIPTEGRNLAGF